MKTDAEIRRDVESELQWDPSIDDRKIGVIVHDGIVTLTGEVCHFYGKWAAEDITQRVSGVRAIANEIQVRIPAAGARSGGILVARPFTATFSSFCSAFASI